VKLMQIDIKEKKEMPLLSRMNVRAELSYDGATPSRTEIKKLIASNIGADEKLLVIKKVETAYGARKAGVEGHVYKNEEDMKKTEKEYLLKRDVKEKKEKKPAEAKEKKEEAKPEDKPAEDKKEQAKPEEKTEKKKEEKQEKPAEQKKQEKPAEEKPKQGDKKQ